MNGRPVSAYDSDSGLSAEAIGGVLDAVDSPILFLVAAVAGLFALGVSVWRRHRRRAEVVR
jgi:hypothetical protein